MAIYSLEIYDEGQSLGLWKRIGMDNPGFVSDDLIRVRSVSDMVTKVLAAIGNQREKVKIFFKGVGSVNYQSVGAGTTQDSVKDRSLQVDSNGELNAAGKIWLPRLTGRVSGIYLLGVDANASNSLLFAVANLLIGVQIHDRVGDGNHIVNFGEAGKEPIRLRTRIERQHLRDSLKKLDRR
ncbi:hypothetical protein BH10ACI1_BH10ACI1_32070 [soil metagenome]